jgi:RNA polymerase sigma-70 factor (ECF subfamily)
VTAVDDLSAVAPARRRYPDGVPATSATDRSTLEEAAAVFGSLRRRLFGIAYRMLGSAVEAEDLVQDVWLRWQETDRSSVLDPSGFLVTTTTRLAINVIQSARSRRESYVGLWLPEPVATSDDPEQQADRGEALELAVLRLLERLSPTERAAYVLREAFDYAHSEIAAILQLTEPNVRQLVARARKHIADERRAPVSSAEQRRFLELFVAAAQKGDSAALETLFASGVVSRSDGGGVARAALVPVVGRARVAHFVASFASHFWEGVTITDVIANGRASKVLLRDGVAFAFVTIEASAEGIDEITWMLNPSKLGAVLTSAPNQTIERGRVIGAPRIGE